MNTLCKNSQFIWSRTMVITLIELYEGHPCLYMTSSIDFKNKNKRNEAIEKIRQTLNKKFFTSLTVKDITTKIHGLRSQYLNEFAKVKKSKVSGASADQIYVPKWQYFELLQFVGTTSSIIVFQGESNIQNTDLANELTIIESQSEIENTSELLYDGEVSNDPISNWETESLMSPPGQSSGTEDITSRPESRSSPLSSFPNKRKRVSQSTLRKDNTTVAERLLDKATKALTDIETVLPKNATISCNKAFAQFIEVEMAKIKNEEIMDRFQEGVLELLFMAKRENRRKNEETNLI